MKSKQIVAVASYIVAACFFIAYLFRQHIALMLLGAICLCIGAVNMIWLYRKK